MRTLHTLPRSAAAATLLLGAAPAPAQPDPPSRVIVFGASYSDLGNVYELVADWPPSPPYDGGRFSNGPLWHEIAGDTLDWPGSDASLRGGLVYAYGGAHTGDSAPTTIPCFPDPIPRIGEQISSFLAGHTPSASDLVIIGINNDLNYRILGIGGALPVDAVANMVAHVESLSEEGAESFLIVNMPPLDALPFVVAAGASSDAERLTKEYNALLTPAMRVTAAALDVEVRIFDLHSVFMQVLDDPAAFGFVNTTDPAQTGGSDICTIVVGGTPVVNPDAYVWWDYSHPTTAMHAVVAAVLVDVLTCPVDFTGDGRLDLFDFLAFQSSFAVGAPRADFDDDGVFTIFDFLAFQNAFAIGCD